MKIELLYTTCYVLLYQLSIIVSVFTLAVYYYKLGAYKPR